MGSFKLSNSSFFGRDLKNTCLKILLWAFLMSPSGPLGFPLSVKWGSALKIESNRLMSNFGHHFQAAPTCPINDLKGEAQEVRGSAVH